MGLTEGILLGMIGSLHCIGMCGPLILAVQAGRGRSAWAGIFLYHGGRILVYTILGLLTGFIGARIAPAGFQQALSVAAGILILLFFLLYRTRSLQPSALRSYHEWIRKTSRRFISRKSPAATCAMGVLNGLLPCGLVYTALAASLAAGNMQGSALFMMGFGMGNLPALLMVRLLGRGFSRVLPPGKTIPAAIIITGILLILRGMNLGIPYISPLLQAANSPAPPLCH